MKIMLFNKLTLWMLFGSTLALYWDQSYFGFYGFISSYRSVWSPSYFLCNLLIFCCYHCCVLWFCITLLTRHTVGCFFFFFSLPPLKIAFYEKLKQKPGMSKGKHRNITTFCTFLLARESYKIFIQRNLRSACRTKSNFWLYVEFQFLL